MTCCFPSWFNNATPSNLEISHDEGEQMPQIANDNCAPKFNNENIKKVGSALTYTSSGPIAGGLASFVTNVFNATAAGFITGGGACCCIWGSYMAYTGQCTPCDNFNCVETELPTLYY